MKLKTSFFVLALTASTALAQSVMAPINLAKTAAKASSARTEESKAVMNQQQAAPAASSSAPAKATPFAPKTTAKPAPAAPASTAAKTSATPTKADTTAKVVQPEMKRPPKDARDPFISIIRTDKTGATPCASGKKCLVIGEIVFRGIMKSSSSTIAVVENPEKKTYFLRENDPVFNGNVVKITNDSIVFREQVIDPAGRRSTREITKHVNPRPIA
jgi:Tfp pilus assembly protein PilP